MGDKCKKCKKNDSIYGSKHRKEIKQDGHEIYNWIIKNDFPDFLQTLCWNCNCGKRINGGVCPHNNI